MRRIVAVLFLLAAGCSGRNAPVGATFAPFRTPPQPLPTDRPTQAVAATEDGRVVVISAVDGAQTRRLYEGTVVSAVSIAPDGKTAYISDAKDPASPCEGEVFAVAAEGPSANVVAMGVSPAASPDGKQLAYTVRSCDRADPAIVVRDLASGKERRWTGRSTGTEPIGNVAKLTWAPDSRHLVYELAYLTSRIAWLDTKTNGTLDQPQVLTPKGAKMTSWSAPEFRGALGGLVALGSSGSRKRAVWFDPSNGKVIRELPAALAGGRAVSSDGSGTHLLVIGRAGELLAWSGGDVARVAAGPFRTVDW